jgi:processive 1,2-diacylglycerol beta-glucosyltransferase
LISQGVPPDRIKAHGLPISEKFNRPVNQELVLRNLGLKPGLPKVLVMGGSLGLGPMKSVIRKLDKLPQPFDIVAVTGKNEELKERLTRKGRKLRHHTTILGFVDNIHELMDVAEMVVTKPGGITTAEALVKRVPMIIINPIPGQEAKNTEFLLSQNVAVEAENASDVMLYVDEFFRNPAKLRRMRDAARVLGRSDAAERAAESILKTLSAKRTPALAGIHEVA